MIFYFKPGRANRRYKEKLKFKKPFNNKGSLEFRLLTKRDIGISLIISIGSFVISIGIIGIKNLFVSMLFLVIPLILTLTLFLVFKPRTSKSQYSKGWDY